MPPMLDLVALHGLRASSPSTVVKIGLADVSVMDDEVKARLTEYVENVESRSSLKGRATPGWWKDGAAPSDLDEMLTCAGDRFLALSNNAMDRLAHVTPATAMDGLVVFLRTHDAGNTAMTCCKLQLETYNDIQWNRGSGAASTALKPVALDNLLPQAKLLQKAARLPGIGTADIWLVDDQIPGTADYWVTFLGASRYPGEHQRLRNVIETIGASLQSDFAVDPDHAVTQAIAATAGSSTAVLPRDFVRSAASAAGVKPSALVKRLEATALGPVLDDVRYALTPQAARDAITTWDLGGDVRLVGPRSELEGRVQKVQEPGGTFLKVRITQGPTVTHAVRR
jgi:hypothetical protein